MDFRRRYLTQMLEAHGGNRSHTARAIGLQRTYLLRLMRAYAINVPTLRRGSPTS